MEKDQLKKFELIVIGGSAGSLEVIIQVMPLLPPDMHSSILIVLHRKNGDSLLTKLLTGKTSLPVVEAEDKEPIRHGTIYIAPSDYHLLVEKDKTLSLDYSEKINYSRPSIDVTLETAAEVYKHEMAAFLLSGANSDGAEGMLEVKKMGGFTVAQKPSDSSVDYMPVAAINLGAASQVMSIDQIKKWFASLPAYNHHTLRGQESP